MNSLEEHALHVAALAYARTRFQTLETTMRVDRARRVFRLLADENPRTARVNFESDELDDALELARLTLLHAGEKDIFLQSQTTTAEGFQFHSRVEMLLREARKIVRDAQGRFTDADKTIRAVVLAFNELVGLLSPCSRMAGDPPCARDGDCPEHGKPTAVSNQQSAPDPDPDPSGSREPGSPEPSEDLGWWSPGAGSREPSR